MAGTLRSILVAVDFGDASTRALTLAGALAGAVGATLHVLHAEALDAPPYFTDAQIEALEGQAGETRARALDYLRAFAEARIAVPFEALVENRTASDAILHAAAASGADLIVMGTHGRRGPSHWWLGSVAERVLRSTPVPLLIVHATGTDVPAEEAFRSGLVLHPPDGSATRTHGLAQTVSAAFDGTTFAADGDDERGARVATGATWVAVPTPTPRTWRWLSRVGEPLVSGCSVPVLFVPEAGEGLTS